MFFVTVHTLPRRYLITACLNSFTGYV